MTKSTQFAFIVQIGGKKPRGKMHSDNKTHNAITACGTSAAAWSMEC